MNLTKLLFASTCSLILMIGCSDNMNDIDPIEPVSVDTLDCFVVEGNWKDGSGSLGVFNVDYADGGTVSQYGFQAFAFEHDNLNNPIKATVVNNGGVDVEFEFFYNGMELTHIVEKWGSDPASPNATYNVSYNNEGLITKLTNQNDHILSYDYDENANPTVWMVPEFPGNASDKIVDIIYGSEKGLVEADDFSHTHAFIYSFVELDLPFLMFKNAIKAYSVSDNGMNESSFSFDECDFNDSGYQISAIDSSIDEGLLFEYECF